MSGSKLGGLKAANTIRKRYGNHFYAIIGCKGGANGHTGGFAANPELAKKAGAIGGKMSKRGKKGTHSASVRELWKRRAQLAREFNEMFCS